MQGLSRRPDRPPIRVAARHRPAMPAHRHHPTMGETRRRQTANRPIFNVAGVLPRPGPGTSGTRAGECGENGTQRVAERVSSDGGQISMTDEIRATGSRRRTGRAAAIAGGDRLGRAEGCRQKQRPRGGGRGRSSSSMILRDVRSQRPTQPRSSLGSHRCCSTSGSGYLPSGTPCAAPSTGKRILAGSC
jgi:hypothetical protein